MNALSRLWDDLRPLDPVRSIRMKFAVVVGASAVLCTFITWLALARLDFRVRYGLILAVLIALAFSQVLAHGMTLPLRQLTAATREMAAGRRAPPVQTRSRDEVGELVRAFTAMSRDLEAVDEQRRRLLADVGHELRTPVAAMRAQLENLADGVRPADPEALEEVLAQVERLGDLLSNLLDLARADGGAVPLHRRPVAVAELLQRVADEVGTARAGVTLDVRVSPPDLVVDADPRRLAQVVTNLMDNAARHARRTVVIEAFGEDTVVIEVTDDGPGLPPDQREVVFERFRTGAPDSGGGTGLGLAIARWAVLLHGGSIGVVPSAVGCRFRVEIPPTASRA